MNESLEPKLRWRNPSYPALAFLALLLVFPGLVVRQLSAFCDPRFILGYAALISLVTLLLYRHDKRQAISQGWRTPEFTLHMVEFLGGWPGAFFAQRILRHKSSKASYQVVFWIIVGVHQFACFDFLQDWHYSNALFSFLVAKIT